eukprot:1694005-Pleurochrysis_carterae.AAC.1
MERPGTIFCSEGEHSVGAGCRSGQGKSEAGGGRSKGCGSKSAGDGAGASGSGVGDSADPCGKNAGSADSMIKPGGCDDS